MPPSPSPSPAPQDRGPQSTTVRGAEPYRPRLAPDDERREIDKAAGPARRLRDLREALPAARNRRPYVAEIGGEDDAGLESAGAVRGPAAQPAAGNELTPAQRLIVIDQAALMLEALYAHLPLKRALHAIDPIQRLRLLRLRHEALDERAFQSEMIEIFTGLRDLHTNYLLPSDYQAKAAYLPFRIEEFYEAGERKYLVSVVSPRSTDATLEVGNEVTHWNGVPIDLAVTRNAAREAGSNLEARRAQGLEALTLRWLGMSLPPDEDWVVLTHTKGGVTMDSRFEWEVIDVRTNDLARGLGMDVPVAGAAPPPAAHIGLDVKTELLRRVRTSLFDAGALVAQEQARAAQAAGPEAAEAPAAAGLSTMPDVFPRFGSVTTPSGTFGYVRLATFAPRSANITGAVREFVRILKTLPQNGLILDVRGNGGGFVNFGERILQTLSPRPITPEPFHFVTTPFTLRVAQAQGDLQPWNKPLATALATGAGFSQGFPLTSPAACNDIGQVYQGPVVLVTDAFCYSTTDIFAAGFQDHQIGFILGCHGNTGAGGANVWEYASNLQGLALQPNPFTELPRGIRMRVAIRRSTRIGAQAGVPLEDLGVEPNERYFMSRTDLLEHNADLIARAAAILTDMPLQALAIAPAAALPTPQVTVTSANLDRVDILVNGRPIESVDVTAASMNVTLPTPVTAGARLSAQGYRQNVLVASARA
jgi:C-terminal processing protease CtpA/Prc